MQISTVSDCNSIVSLGPRTLGCLSNSTAEPAGTGMVCAKEKLDCISPLIDASEALILHI